METSTIPALGTDVAVVLEGLGSLVPDGVARRKRSRVDGGLYDGDLALRTARRALEEQRRDERLRRARALSRQRREWDSNPRRVAPHTLSKRADSAALASLRGSVRDLPGGAIVGDRPGSQVARSQHAPGDPAAPERFR